jgi:rhodanese-related sulfurtransferase
MQNTTSKNYIGDKSGSTVPASPTQEELAALKVKLPELPRITCEQLKGMIYKGNGKTPIIVDTRHPTIKSLGCIPLAINIPPIPANEQEKKLLSLPHDRPVIFYCDCPDDNEAAKTAEKVLKLNNGFKPENILVLWKGWPRWNELGYPYACTNQNILLH